MQASSDFKNVITLVVIFMVHLMACIFFLVSKFEDED